MADTCAAHLGAKVRYCAQSFGKRTHVVGEPRYGHIGIVQARVDNQDVRHFWRAPCAWPCEAVKFLLQHEAICGVNPDIVLYHGQFCATPSDNGTLWKVLQALLNLCTVVIGSSMPLPGISHINPCKEKALSIFLFVVGHIAAYYPGAYTHRPVAVQLKLKWHGAVITESPPGSRGGRMYPFPAYLAPAAHGQQSGGASTARVCQQSLSGCAGCRRNQAAVSAQIKLCSSLVILQQSNRLA